MQHQILINVIIFVAYVLNLLLNTQRSHILAHNALENGAWFWLMTDARYIALPLISRYHCLDPTNRDISGLHCITLVWKWALCTVHYNFPSDLHSVRTHYSGIGNTIQLQTHASEHYFAMFSWPDDMTSSTEISATLGSYSHSGSFAPTSIHAWCKQ